VYRGLARTGVVGVLRGDSISGAAVALRADTDALQIEAANAFDCSEHKCSWRCIVRRPRFTLDNGDLTHGK